VGSGRHDGNNDRKPARRSRDQTLVQGSLYSGADAIVLGALFGWLAPAYATNDWIKALGDGFIKLIKMVIARSSSARWFPESRISGCKKVGRIGVKALIYFEIVSTFALVIGLIVGNVVRPGAGFGGAMANAQAVATYAKQAESQRSVDFFLHIIPDTVVGPSRLRDLAGSAVFNSFGFALMALASAATPCAPSSTMGARVFGVIAIVMKAAPIGAFGAMAFTSASSAPARS